MFDEEPSPLTRTGRTLDQMSIEELEARVVALQADIAATEVVLAKKRAHRAAADAVFGGAGS